MKTIRIFDRNSLSVDLLDESASRHADYDDECACCDKKNKKVCVSESQRVQEQFFFAEIVGKVCAKQYGEDGRENHQ